MHDDPLMLATRLRAHLLEMDELERKRLVDAIFEGRCRSCGGLADHSFCDAAWFMDSPDGGYYESYEVR